MRLGVHQPRYAKIVGGSGYAYGCRGVELYIHTRSFGVYWSALAVAAPFIHRRATTWFYLLCHVAERFSAASHRRTLNGLVWRSARVEGSGTVNVDSGIPSSSKAVLTTLQRFDAGNLYFNLNGRGLRILVSPWSLAPGGGAVTTFTHPSPHCIKQLTIGLN
jgi:hypothetical protein